MAIFEFILGLACLSLAGSALAFLIWLVVREQVTTKKCPHCNGTGRLPNDEKK